MQGGGSFFVFFRVDDYDNLWDGKGSTGSCGRKSSGKWVSVMSGKFYKTKELKLLIKTVECIWIEAEGVVFASRSFDSDYLQLLWNSWMLRIKGGPGGHPEVTWSQDFWIILRRFLGASMQRLWERFRTGIFSKTSFKSFPYKYILHPFHFLPPTKTNSL